MQRRRVGLILLGRLFRSLLLLIAVTFATFALVSAIPGDAAYTRLGARATPEQLAELRAEQRLDQPLVVQYGYWLGGAVTGDLGESFLTSQPVSEALAQRIPPTASLLGATVILGAAISTILGVIGATRGGAVARAIDSLGLLGLAFPPFVVGLILVAVFGVWLGWLPISGFTPLTENPVGWLKSIALPVVGLTVGMVGILARQLKVSLEEVLEQEFVVNLRANGASRTSVVFRHGLRNASLPVVATLGVIVAGLLSGSVLIEQVFGFPGLGTLVVQSAAQADLPLVTGGVAAMTLVVALVNFVIDLVSLWLHPTVSAS